MQPIGVTLGFEGAAALDEAFKRSPAALLPADPTLVETRYVFPLAFTEHLVIGPEARA